ncbi:ATP-binding protein, partial [Hungatella hathewayi]|uniref:ATP-binding protein n=1 Tax=Hungatella hathewayi TaxID=154046 RepID=UPI000FEE7DD7
MKKIYLPSLNKITVDNYSLYAQCPSFEFVFEEGISAIVGANGIGKTTFVNMIIYALVGYKKEERRNKKALNLQDITLQDTNFFKDRMNYNFDGGLNEAASVTLEYSLGSNTLIIQRSLYNDEIQKLIVNYKEVKQRAESDYQNIVNKYSGQTVDKMVPGAMHPEPF